MNDQLTQPEEEKPALTAGVILTLARHYRDNQSSESKLVAQLLEDFIDNIAFDRASPGGHPIEDHELIDQDELNLLLASFTELQSDIQLTAKHLGKFKCST